MRSGYDRVGGTFVARQDAANAIIGFIQEGKAEKAMDAIRHMLAPHASVLRDGERRSVAGETLVPGDIVLLEAGDKVPADLRLLRGVFGTEPVPLLDGLLIVAVGVALFAVIETEKQLRLRLRAMRAGR